MVVIAAIPLEEALWSRATKQPSARTLRTRQLEEDAEAILHAISEKGAADIEVDEQEDSASHYLQGLRAALRRGGHTEVFLQKRRGAPKIVAWKARPEDAVRIEARKETGARMGQLARDRAAAARAPKKKRVRR
jgi:hypothetical protein